MGFAMGSRRRMVAGAVVARRRTAALEVGVDRLLDEASVRAAEQLKTTWPKLSAATLKLPVRMIPLLVGLLAVVTIVVAPGVGAPLPAAFRIWIVWWPVPHSLDGRSCSTPEEEDEPIYTIIAPLRGEAKVVDQLLTAIERLNAYQLIWKPFRWRKTEHGLDDESRQERTTRSLLELERLVSGLIRRDELSQIRN
jgi:hypothetical protein